jgi:hypothetical protein
MSNRAAPATVAGMRYSGVYAVVLALHLLTVVFLVGPAAVAGVVSTRHARAGHAQALRDASRTSRSYTLATLLTVLLGMAMVGLSDIGDQWEFSQLWISASFALWIIATALTLGLVVPTQAKAASAIEEGGDGGSFAGRLAAGAGLTMIAWTAIIVLMVAKPGA